MKKYTLILFTFAFVLGLFTINVSYTNAYDSGCISGGPYSVTTGQLCSLQTNTFISGCTGSNLYSPVTGQFCGNVQNNYQINTFDPGCVYGAAYSITTGQLCYGSGVVNPPNIFLNQQFQIGSRGPDVVALQQMLTNAGFSVGVIDGIYGPITDRAYLSYQSQYQNPIPTPYPVYGQPPVISGVSGPQSIGINQSGTWTVTASSPTCPQVPIGYGTTGANYYCNNGGNLNYSVNWGDQSVYPYPANTAPTYLMSQQSATFTHTYLQAGTYTAIFTVTNSTGQSAQTSLSVVVGGSTNYTPPSIYSLSPTSGRVGTQVTIYGTGLNYGYSGCNAYSCTNGVPNPGYKNTVYFGGSVISNAYSPDGSSLIFTVPTYSHPACLDSYPACAVAQSQIFPGSYPVSVSNGYSTSNALNFTVTSY